MCGFLMDLLETSVSEQILLGSFLKYWSFKKDLLVLDGLILHCSVAAIKVLNQNTNIL
jgi:hypothetical protein